MKIDDEKVTLTQRRTSDNGAAKLHKSKLQSLNEFEEEEGSSKRVVVWVIIIIALAAAAYLGLKNYLQSSDEDSDDQTAEETIPTPTPSLEDQLIASSVLPDDEALNLQEESKYNASSQSIGSASEDKYTLSSLYIQPYNTFTRISFTVESTGANKVPQSTVAYEVETTKITWTINNVTQDNSLLEWQEAIDVTDSIISTIAHEVAAGENESYSIILLDESTYVLHSYEDAGVQKIALDIKESEPVENLDITTTPITTTISQVTPTQTSGNILETQFSKNPQKLVTGTTGNPVSITKYSFVGGSIFSYKYTISGGLPNVEANLDGTNLIIKISNLALDGITGNGGTGYRDFTLSGVTNVNTLNASNSSNVSTYTFGLDKASDYRLYFDQANGLLILEIKQ